jgi:iduronate 2-sulfatase
MIGRVLSAWVVLLLTGAAALAEPPKNVLFFFIDDLRPELACYGKNNIHSPNIDALAAEGTLFQRAYCQQAICAPSRASVMAGQYPDSLGIHDLSSPLRRTLPDVISLPRYFQSRGYVTSSFGKVYHHHTDDKPYWSELPDLPGQKYGDAQVNDDIIKRAADARSRGLTGIEVFKVSQGPSTEALDADDAVYQDGAVAQQAIDALRGNDGKPFFMCVGIAKPHLPFTAPKRYWDLYQRDQFEVPPRKLPQAASRLAKTNWGELRAYTDIPKDGPLTDEKTLELCHGYAACVSFADAQVGKVMAELNRLGLRDNTVVVLWGDHGYKLGDYGLWCKHTNFEIDTRVPLIVSAPELPQGKRSNALVEMIDVFPTLAKLTGGQAPDSCEGQSLVDLLENSDSPFRDSAFSQYPRGSIMGYSLRTEKWRYNEWIQTKTRKVLSTELYDQSKGSLVDSNVVSEPQHKDLVAQLSKKLDALSRLNRNK